MYSNQLFHWLSRRHLHQVRHMEITSRELSVYHTTCCCFLKTFCSRGPTSPSEHCASRTLLKLTGSCELRYQLSASQTHSSMIPQCYYPLFCLLHLSAFHQRKEDVCAASFFLFFFFQGSLQSIACLHLFHTTTAQCLELH